MPLGPGEHYLIAGGARCLIEKVDHPWASPIRSVMAGKVHTVGKTMHEWVFWGQSYCKRTQKLYFKVSIGTKCKTVLSSWEHNSFLLCVVYIVFMFNYGGLAETPASLTRGNGPHPLYPEKKRR